MSCSPGSTETSITRYGLSILCATCGTSLIHPVLLMVGYNWLYMPWSSYKCERNRQRLVHFAADHRNTTFGQRRGNKILRKNLSRTNISRKVSASFVSLCLLFYSLFNDLFDCLFPLGRGHFYSQSIVFTFMPTLSWTHLFPLYRCHIYTHSVMDTFIPILAWSLLFPHCHGHLYSHSAFFTFIPTLPRSPLFPLCRFQLYLVSYKR